MTVLCWLECVKYHFRSHSNELERFHMCQKQLNSYWKKRDGSICNNVNAMDNTEIPPSLHCGDSQGWRSFTAIKEIVASYERWPWSTDRFAMAVVIRSVDNNTTVGHLSREFSHLFSDSLRRNGCGKWQPSPLIQGGLKISCYVTLHGKKKLVVLAWDIIAEENKTE